MKTELFMNISIIFFVKIKIAELFVSLISKLISYNLFEFPMIIKELLFGYSKVES